LEEQQDAFDFCYKVHYLPDEERTNDPEYTRQIQALQAKLQILDRQRREVLAQLQQLLGRSKTLRDFLLQELEAWRERQLRACMGAPADTRLRPLETWFTELGQGLFQLLQLLRVLGELQHQLTYERDPLKAETPLLERRLKEQLTFLLQRWELGGDAGGRRWGCPGSSCGPLMTQRMLRGWSEGREEQGRWGRGWRRRGAAERAGGVSGGEEEAEGRAHCSLQVPERRLWRGGSWGLSPLPWRGLILSPQTSTLPFVIISNNNQLSSAWASILWFNMLSSDPKASGTLLPSPGGLPFCPQPCCFEQNFFSSPPPAPWPRLSEVLSWQFESVAERGLSEEHLLMLAEKLFGES
ncbi:STAT2 protein, partial [Piaya cayana]|nr:STAT2 protein [Piaya cayana]